MRGRSSSMQGRISRVMEKDKADKAKDEPHLSGAYIRSLVKHLTSTTTKDSFDRHARLPKSLNANEPSLRDQSPPQPPQQHKKQVRKRQHASRPYQERLLNMAEARREIVTALKFHRASMKQQEAPQTHPQSNQSPPSNPYYWPISAIAPPPLPPLYHENLNLALPNQTLGLNLNLQDFQNCHKPYSTSSSSSSTSISVGGSAEELVGNSGGSGGLHHAMDDEEMEEIRSLGEQHQMEWNDTVNMVTSARWIKFLKMLEDGHNDPFDQVIEFPPWMINANENYNVQHDYLHDPALPCMDIGEIEGMYGEWLP